jgi:Tfp pilus assembly protein PilF
MIAQQTGRPQQAFDYYLKSLELDSNNLTALLGLFQVSCQMGTFAQVIHYLQVYLQMHPGDSSVMFCLAALYAREGQVQRARDLLRDILALEPDRQDAKDLLEEMEHKAVQINRE